MCLKEIKITKKEKEEFSSSFSYESSLGMQKILVRYKDDAEAINLLNQVGLEKQAIMILDRKSNKFMDL